MNEHFDNLGKRGGLLTNESPSAAYDAQDNNSEQNNQHHDEFQYTNNQHPL